MILERPMSVSYRISDGYVRLSCELVMPLDKAHEISLERVLLFVSEKSDTDHTCPTCGRTLK